MESVHNPMSGGQPDTVISMALMADPVSLSVVRSVEQHPKDQFPTKAVYGDVDTPELRLITCGGDFDDEARSYRDNIVVFAEMVGSSRR